MNIGLIDIIPFQKQAGKLAVSVYPLAFPAHAFKVDADDFRAVEGLFGIFQAGLHVIGRIFFQDKTECLHAFFCGKAGAGMSCQDDAFVAGSEFMGNHVGLSHDAERHLWVESQAAEFATLRGTMDVDGIFAVPCVVDGDGVALIVFSDH